MYKTEKLLELPPRDLFTAHGLISVPSMWYDMMMALGTHF